jgi:MYXO-CTERM domain-containing protein
VFFVAKAGKPRSVAASGSSPRTPTCGPRRSSPESDPPQPAAASAETSSTRRTARGWCTRVKVPVALRILAACLLAALAAPAAAAAHSDLELLRRHAPVLHYDARETERATAVEALTADPPVDGAGTVALRPRRHPLPDVVYGRSLAGRDGRTWLQYWMLYADNPQDRGVLRTGRHEGDWEVVQVGLDRRGGPVAVTYAQHSWAEACPRWSGHVYVANGSHASYPEPGEHGRPWPDPDDEARGDGRVVRPRVAPFGRWVAYRGRWGRTRASRVPAESPSPRGPAFQDEGPWRDPAGYHAAARACGSGAPPHPWPVYAGGAAALLLVGAAGILARRRRSRRSESCR